MENYKHVHDSHGHSVSWENSCVENPQYKPIPHLNHNPRVPTKQCITQCYCRLVSLKMYLFYWSIT